MKAFLDYVCNITNHDESLITSFIDYSNNNKHKIVVFKYKGKFLGILSDKLSSFGHRIPYKNKIIGNDSYSLFCMDKFRSYLYLYCRFI